MPPGRSDETLDPTPLLTTTDHQIPRNQQHRFLRRPPSLRGAARFLRRASSRRLLREPSMRVRESAAEQIEEQQSDWAYSKPIVILDLIWNLTFVMVSIIVMVMSRKEAPESPLRLWILGYCVQCVVHMVCVCVEFKRRYRANNANDDDEYADYDDESSSAKHLESANTMFSFIWWIIGFYWVSSGGQDLTRDSPQLYWLCITFLAFDVFFVVICVAVACVIGIAVCCCLPCIIAILYAVADQEGATKDDIDCLPRYKFRRIGDFDKQNGEIQVSFGGVMTECNSDTPTETVLPPEAAECCICLCSYEDGTELRELPCCHHFHCTCIDKWLYINSTCPLCKYNILKTGNQSSSEDV